MSLERFDLKYLECAESPLKTTTSALQLNEGDISEVFAGLSAFEDDVKGWCIRNGRMLLWISEEGNGTRKYQIHF